VTEASHEEALKILGEVFEHRIARRLVQRRHLIQEGQSGIEEPLAFVLPVSAEEVQLLAEVAERHHVPLVALGGGTAPDPETSTEVGRVLRDAKKGGILIRFDLMRRTRLSADFEEAWAEVEPGALWLELDNDLRTRGRGLAVYPTSAPRSTIGGWLAMDGIGVGSFEYGWLRENVLSADVVLPGGERREVRGEDLRSFEPRSSGGIVVGAKLRTRRADTDVPFAASFSDAENLIRAVAGLFEAGVPLWHLAFLNPEMSYARGLGEDHLLFGAYPRERDTKIEEGLRGAFEPYRGQVFAAAEAYRVWGERFFPAVPSHPIPRVTRQFVSVEELPQMFPGVGDRSEQTAVQGTVARSGEVLLLTFDARQEG
jgi:FAD/FMN-containing dehydrogenase